jgi:hypothetical protein
VEFVNLIRAALPEAACTAKTVPEKSETVAEPTPKLVPSKVSAEPVANALVLEA